jgi:hypothetical protein
VVEQFPETNWMEAAAIDDRNGSEKVEDRILSRGGHSQIIAKYTYLP